MNYQGAPRKLGAVLGFMAGFWGQGAAGVAVIWSQSAFPHPLYHCKEEGEKNSTLSLGRGVGSCFKAWVLFSHFPAVIRLASFSQVCFPMTVTAEWSLPALTLTQVPFSEFSLPIQLRRGVKKQHPLRAILLFSCLVFQPAESSDSIVLCFIYWSKVGFYWLW